MVQLVVSFVILKHTPEILSIAHTEKFDHKRSFFVGYTFITKHLLFCSNRYKVSHLPSLRNLPIHSLVLDARDRGCVQQEMVSQLTASCRHDGPQNTRHVGSSLEAPKTNTLKEKWLKQNQSKTGMMVTVKNYS